MKPTALKPAEQDALRQHLEQRRDELRRDLQTVQADRDDDIDANRGRDTVQDAGEHGDQLSRDEVRRGEQDRDAAELQDVSAALQRMDEGHYGECVDCGTTIGAQRLQAQPAALRCIRCQEAFERARQAPLGAGRAA
jgi:RNA polymerase-binding protein DksA